MTFRKNCCLFLSGLIFACFFCANPAVSAEQSQEESTVEKNKKEILNDIDLFERGLHSTKSCVSEAKTIEELEQCRMEATSMKLERAYDMLQEIGMTPEERRLYELRPEKYR